MSTSFDLILRRVRPLGSDQVDMGIRDGRIAAMAPDLVGTSPEYDGAGRDVTPGIHDHHLHLFATAARMNSIHLSQCGSEADVIRQLRTAGPTDSAEWIRATGLTEIDGQIPDRHQLDQWVADRPLRIQDRTGALWLLNSAAIERLGSATYPPCVEIDASGQPTGRIWRGDQWLREVIGSAAPSLKRLSQLLAAEGITSVTDAGASNGAEEAHLFAEAIARGELTQHLTVMGCESLPLSTKFERGPLKLLYDERDPVDPHTIAERICHARAQNRNVAAHCVTIGELIIYLEALDLAGGALPGDRVEHGGIIPKEMIASLRDRALTVITQPDFIRCRGDRYIATMPEDERDDLYRLSSLVDAGVEVRVGSDAPYGSFSPWQAMVAACTRETSSGAVISRGEAISAHAAARLFGIDDPAAFRIGAAADLCLLGAPLRQCVGQVHNSPVETTFIAGVPVFER